MYQYVKDRASRTQSESSLSNFAEAKSILEVKLQRSRKADFRGAASMIELRVQK